MAKAEKAPKPIKPAKKTTTDATVKSSKTKRKSPPAKVQLSSEFVKDSNDEDDDTPAPPVKAKEPVVKKSVPDEKVPTKAAVVEVSSEEESSSEDSDGSDSETSKSDEKITKAAAKNTSASASEIGSETEKEKEDSSDNDSDSSSGISIVAPTNKGKGPAADSRPRPTTAPTSHVSETRPAPAFQPPLGFKSINPPSSTSKITNVFPSQTTVEKQIWYITAPANVPLSSLKELALDKLVEGTPVMTYEDVDYSFTTDDTVRQKTAVILPSESGFKPQPTEVQKIVHLRQVVKLPTVPQSDTGIPSSATTTLPQQPQFTVQKRTKREQPKGLKMRYRPSGAGTGELGHIGSSDDDEPASKRSKPSSTAPNVGKKRKERDDDAVSGEKKKKKREREKHRSATEDAMEGVITSSGTPKKSKDLVPSSSSVNESAKSNGVETPKKKDKERKKKRDKERT